MNKQQLQEYARHGAQARLAALDQERDQIFKMFPELRDGAGRDGGEPKARKDHMSPEARKRQAERMRAYWAERRAKTAAKGAKKSSGKKAASAAKRQGRMSAEARQRQAERMRAYWATKKGENAASAEGAQAGAGNTGKARRKRRNT
jgi:hypothetical protein